MIESIVGFFEDVPTTFRTGILIGGIFLGNGGRDSTLSVSI